MSDIPRAPAVSLELKYRLALQPANDETACGELLGYPLTMTVLGVDPPSLMFAFWTASRTDPPLTLPQRLQSLADRDLLQVSFDDGFAWLSFYDLSHESAESIQHMLDEFAHALKAAGLPAPRGCVVCGSEQTAEALLLEGRTVRICPACVDSLAAERERLEEELNRPAAWHGLALPMACLYVACGWMGFWWLADRVVDWLGGVIWINFFTMMVGFALLAAVGFALGFPVGWVIRRSGLSRLSPTAVSLLVVLMCSVLGEILYIALVIFQQFGVFDVTVALRFLLPVLQNYPVEWIIAKLLTAIMISAGCFVASEQKKLSLTAVPRSA